MKKLSEHLCEIFISIITVLFVVPLGIVFWGIIIDFFMNY